MLRYPACMGRLRDRSSGIEIDLRARHRVGRAEGADLRLTDARVSGDHALLRWELGSWVVQDLSSTNGVFLDGTRVTRGESVALHAGATLGFGVPDADWELVDTGPPEACAISLTERRLAVGGQIILPDPGTPRIVVVLVPERGWIVRDERGERPARDGEAVSDGVRTWELRLPTVAAKTARTGRSTSVSRCTLVCHVSQDEESVQLRLRVDGEERNVGEHVWGYFIVLLARAREADAAGGADRDEQGWLLRSDIEAQLRTAPNQLSVWVHRFRRRLAELGVEDAEVAIEARDRGRVVRIGIDAAVSRPGAG